MAEAAWSLRAALDDERAKRCPNPHLVEALKAKIQTAEEGLETKGISGPKALDAGAEIPLSRRDS